MNWSVWTNNGPYAPWNCVWELPKYQMRNRGNTSYVYFDNRLVTISEVAEMTGLPYGTVYKRTRPLG